MVSLRPKLFWRPTGFGFRLPPKKSGGTLASHQTTHFPLKLPTLLQGLLVCEQCGYALYRTSTRTTRRQIKYYRCLGSDRYRHLRGPACSCRPIRQDFLDALVWQEVLRLLRTPQLIQAELERRRTESLNSGAVQQRQEQVSRELTRLGQQMDKLLDAYQEGLITLADLRKRSPEIKKKLEAAGAKVEVK